MFRLDVVVHTRLIPPSVDRRRKQRAFVHYLPDVILNTARVSSTSHGCTVLLWVLGGLIRCCWWVQNWLLLPPNNVKLIDDDWHRCRPRVPVTVISSRRLIPLKCGSFRFPWQLAGTSSKGNLVGIRLYLTASQLNSGASSFIFNSAIMAIERRYTFLPKTSNKLIDEKFGSNRNWQYVCVLIDYQQWTAANDWFALNIIPRTDNGSLWIVWQRIAINRINYSIIGIVQDQFSGQTKGESWSDSRDYTQLEMIQGSSSKPGMLIWDRWMVMSLPRYTAVHTSRTVTLIGSVEWCTWGRVVRVTSNQSQSVLTGGAEGENQSLASQKIANIGKMINGWLMHRSDQVLPGSKSNWNVREDQTLYHQKYA